MDIKLPYDSISSVYNPLSFVKVDEDGKTLITIEGLQQLSEYEPFFIIPKEAKPCIIETETGDFDVIYDKKYPVMVEWRRKDKGNEQGQQV